jgi:hypothetical protein
MHCLRLYLLCCSCETWPGLACSIEIKCLLTCSRRLHSGDYFYRLLTVPWWRKVLQIWTSRLPTAEYVCDDLKFCIQMQNNTQCRKISVLMHLFTPGFVKVKVKLSQCFRFN